MSIPPHATVIIPNWNGEAFLVRCVSSALAAAREHRKATGEVIEVMVVDDASTDKSLELIEKDCPGARIVRRERNGGYAKAVNTGATESEAGLLVLLNSDIAVPLDFFTQLLAPMAKSNVFAVTAKTVNWSDGEPNFVNMTAEWVRGQIALVHSDPSEACETLFIQGGSCVIRREPFLEMGGFPTLYHPGYWEDSDLSLRAVKAGWRIIYEPKAVGHHLGKASLTARYGRDGVRRMTERNRLLFTWAMLSERGLLLQHALGLPGWIAREIFRGEGATRLRAFVDALKMLNQVIVHRRENPPPRAIGDREALAITAPPVGVECQFVPGEI